MGAAFFECERKVLLSFTFLSVDLELGLIAHQASRVRGGRTNQWRQKQGCVPNPRVDDKDSYVESYHLDTFFLNFHQSDKLDSLRIH